MSPPSSRHRPECRAHARAPPRPPGRHPPRLRRFSSLAPAPVNAFPGYPRVENPCSQGITRDPAPDSPARAARKSAACSRPPAAGRRRPNPRLDGGGPSRACRHLACMPRNGGSAFGRDGPGPLVQVALEPAASMACRCGRRAVRPRGAFEAGRSTAPACRQPAGLPLGRRHNRRRAQCFGPPTAAAALVRGEGPG